MSGFKTWNKDINLKQWGETSTELFTNKHVTTTKSMQSDLGFLVTIKNLSQEKKHHLDNLKRLIPKSYNFKEQKTQSFGLIAQDVEKIYPQLVNTNENGTKSVNYTELIPLLLLQTNNLERKIEELKNNN